MNSTTSPTHDHITPLRIYLLVGAALLLLTAITVKVSFIHLGPWNAVVALLIASGKALLVAFFFMHLIYDKKVYMLIFSVGIVILTVFITLTMADTLRRGEINAAEANPINPAAKIYHTPASNTNQPIESHAADSTKDSVGVEKRDTTLYPDSADLNRKNK